MTTIIDIKEMAVCFVDQARNGVFVVGFGRDGNDALQSAIDSCGNNGIDDSDMDAVQDWVETLDQYAITDDCYKTFDENGSCDCVFSDCGRIVEKR